MKNIYSLYNNQGKRLYLTLDERKAFFKSSKAQPNKAKTLCQLLYYTGCRVSEALHLTTDRVDMAGGEIIIQSLKKRSITPHYRPIPVPMAFLEELEHRIVRLNQFSIGAFFFMFSMILFCQRRLFDAESLFC